MNSSAASIECSVQPLDFSFHPTRPTLVGVACVDGTVEVHDFRELIDSSKQPSDNNLDGGGNDEIDTILSSTPVHTQLLPSKASESGIKEASSRAVLFAENENALYSGGTAGDLARLDVEIVSTFAAQSTPKSILWRVPDASYNKSPIHVLHEIKPSGLVVTGDDAGGVRLWDPRLLGTTNQAAASDHNNNSKTLPGRKPLGCVFGWKEHSDYISAVGHSEDGMTVLAASADCTLSVYDLRMAEQALQKHVDKEKIVRRSDHQDDELLSLKIIKNGKKVVCGTAEGILAVWSWGTWGDISDRFPGHPATVDALEVVDQDTLLTGSSDGLIRVVSIHPDKLLGVLGDHGGFPIEKLEFNADRNFVGSLTHDNLIRLWDARILQEDYEGEGDDGDAKMAESALHAAAAIKSGRSSDDEWEDMDEDTDSDEESSDDDDDDKKPMSKNEKRKGKLKTENEKFFEDL